MEFIKLNRRHTLFHRGYKFAFVFRDWGKGRPNEHKMAELVRKIEPTPLYQNEFYGKSPGTGQRRPFYIGFKNETTATMVQLQL